METTRFEAQLIDVVMEVQVALAQPGYISLLMVQGIGPIPVHMQTQYIVIIKCKKRQL